MSNPTEKTCKNCFFWERTPVEETGENWARKTWEGDCCCEKFQYQLCEQDGLSYEDAEGYAAGFTTGENFGCIHFKGR